MAKENIIIKGVPVSGGVALGEVQVIRDSAFEVVRRSIPAAQVDGEIVRLKEASQAVIDELQASKNKAIRAIGEQGAKVFEAQILIASDERFFETVIDHIKRSRVNAEYAYEEALTATLDRLQKSKDPYIRQMVHDIRSVSERILSLLLGVTVGDQGSFDNMTILAGRIFSPGQIMSFAKRNVVGFVTEEGGPTSHMGLIVRSLGIPAIMVEYGVAEAFPPGASIIINGNDGEIIVNPDADTWRDYRRLRLRKKTQPLAILMDTQSLEPVCTDGRKVTLEANLEVPGPLDEHLVRLGIGVGLYRTEFLYFSKQAFPDEEEQYQVYADIVRRFNPFPVTLRTFDLGGDKYAEEVGRMREDNPALGCRGIRISLNAPHLFRLQLRAMLRASVEGHLKILLPMVCDIGELDESLDVIDRTKRELRKGHIPFNEDVPIGIMIEVPSAAMSASYLAEKADFFSIGTNDLIQYTMAADRGNHRVSRYYMGHHPAVLRLIQMTVNAAHENDIPVSVCGEMAGTRIMTPLLVGLGVDELSMNPTQLPVVADWVSGFSYIDAKRFASRVMRMTTAEKVSRALQEAFDYVKRQKKGT